MLLQVETEHGVVFVDVGFGGLTLTAPVAMRWHDPQPTPHERVRLVPVDSDHLLQAEVGGAWVDVYRFDLSRHLPADYVQQNWHTATKPNALFANNLVVTLPTPEGRHALFNRTLTWRPRSGDKQQRLLQTRQELQEVLESLFGLEVSPEELDAAWEVSGRSSEVSPAFS
jgi:N-hydroxyarylamine O-acetyltransferase